MPSPSVELTGKIEYIGQIQQSKTSDYTWRDVVLVHGSDKYPEYSKITLKKDNTSLIEPFAIGQTVTAFCFIGGTKYTKKGSTVTSYFNNLTCTSIKDAANGAPASNEALTPEQMEDDDDLPF